MGDRIQVGYVGHSSVPLRDLVSAAGTSGRRVGVSSYLLAPGHSQVELCKADADLVTAPLLRPYPEPSLVDLVIRRFAVATHHVSWSNVVELKS